uniref:Uncharacterized protein n=1 Tax=Chromera velia CCMP2878 TaxID=1169474 RepID=A0A0G4F608_9ALVE|eukprot:Cvel_15414.t1-p1 / transcript=Cvel_15414.t1 / gene=Cvel_15414 / organism=Chromera_velia_CCMP2878 / gene_product=15,16-dihydrobiliverdin:ferredoxin oxidoreductase, putative / transcript_product=15,16-dihydrobiliverdin:ferredoxin oxidoreductase, putative / location=Cvel_scaffold1139:12463-13548(+) / protein_length=362 / sequence_SO=supercontig / SO=protein_coding / is_pseudo=false
MPLRLGGVGHVRLSVGEGGRRDSEETAESEERDGSGGGDLETPLPWRFHPTSTEEAKTYKPFAEWLWSFLNDSLEGVERVALDSELETRTGKGGVRIANACVRSSEFRKIRMTFIDGGGGLQVFHSLFYPHWDLSVDPSFDGAGSALGKEIIDQNQNPSASFCWPAPLFGFDLIKFSEKRVLEVIDVHPLIPTEEYRDRVVDSRFRSVRNRFTESFGERPSERFYDSQSFFSKQMLMGRFNSTSHHDEALWPAFQSYVKEYVKLVKDLQTHRDTVIAGCKEEVETAPPVQSLSQERQQLHDTYSAQHDPAVPVFSSLFGSDWTEEFLFSFRFDLADRTAVSLKTDKKQDNESSASSRGGDER